VYYDSGLYRVNYEDGDFEDQKSGEIRSILVSDDDFDGGLMKRRNKLQKIVLHIGAMVANVGNKGSVKSEKDEFVVYVTDLVNQMVKMMRMKTTKMMWICRVALFRMLRQCLCLRRCICHHRPELSVCLSRVSHISYLYMGF
jgi:hypothetical protein